MGYRKPVDTLCSPWCNPAPVPAFYEDSPWALLPGLWRRRDEMTRGQTPTEGQMLNALHGFGVRQPGLDWSHAGPLSVKADAKFTAPSYPLPLRSSLRSRVLPIYPPILSNSGADLHAEHDCLRVRHTNLKVWWRKLPDRRN
jgi:hypothetical protein